MTLKRVTVIESLGIIFEQIILRTIQSQICLEMKPFWDTPNSVLYWAALTGECKWKFQTTHMWESVPPDQNGLLLHSVHNVIGLVPAAVAPDREGGRRESSIFPFESCIEKEGWKLPVERGILSANFHEWTHDRLVFSKAVLKVHSYACHLIITQMVKSEILEALLCIVSAAFQL